ncbi:MAG: hypothetical protein QNJ12_05495 [Ilumatobacter sp.]|uniref:hypothetical protein n=1 Tax=Ilumatobacter sp. TaxID=1967498 RepID=UPI002639F090|nr:hypothetical protein [Ilumatobacter sp.]MDJ0768224.1 hypothetical protein [Ilumatobacter sp.]
MTGKTVEELWLVRLGGPGKNLIAGNAEFTGTVMDADGVMHEGTLQLLAIGEQDPGLPTPSDFPWEGRWFIRGGTGDLAGARGHGTGEGPSFVLTYEGEIHLPH